MKMTLAESEKYLTASREYLENSVNRLHELGVRRPYTLLGDLFNEQMRLEGLLWTEKQKAQGLGFFWGAVAVSLTVIAGYVYDIYTKSKMQSERLDCISNYQKMYVDNGYSQTDALNMAANICSGDGGTKKDIMDVMKSAIYGGVIIFSIYVIYKLMVKK